MASSCSRACDHRHPNPRSGRTRLPMRDDTMVTVTPPSTWAHWNVLAGRLISEGVHPGQVMWADPDAEPSLFTAAADGCTDATDVASGASAAAPRWPANVTRDA